MYLREERKETLDKMSGVSQFYLSTLIPHLDLFTPVHLVDRTTDIRYNLRKSTVTYHSSEITLNRLS